MRLLPVSLLLASACAPHDGVVKGDYVAYFSSGSSLVLDEITRGRNLDLGDQENLDRLGLEPIDCRYLSEEDEGKRLPFVDYETECSNGEDGDSDGYNGNEDACGSSTGYPDDCTDHDGISSQKDVQLFTWLYDYAFYKKEAKIDAYRVEVVMTSEHDLQLTVHQNVPRFGDFRFGWVIDPYFQPVVCADKEGGGAELVEVDGNWLENWSASEEGGTLYHLNAYAYQLNPNTGDTYWSLEQDLRAGDSFGRFEDDDFYGHPIDYTLSHSVLFYPEPLYLHTYVGASDYAPYLSYTDGKAIPSAGRDGYEAWVEAVKEQTTYSDENPSDLASIGKSDFDLQIEIENNDWRIDENDSDEVAYESSTNGANGLENWIGINPSWVRFDITPEQLAALEPGRQEKPLKGSFQVHLDGLASASKLFVSGEFTIDNIREDIWGYSPTLDEIKREENGTPDCGDEVLTEAETATTL